jgi:hypothetical protein
MVVRFFHSWLVQALRSLSLSRQQAIQMVL